MAGVSYPFQPFDDHTSVNDISDFVMDSSDFGFPEWHKVKLVQEVTLLGDPDNKDSTSLSTSSDVIEQSTISSETPLVAVSNQPEKPTVSKMATPNSPITSACGVSTEVTGTPPTTSALPMSSGPSILPAFAMSSNSSDTSCGKQVFFVLFF